ncbi:Lrp/AsnC family transcriptional regulator [Methylobacterium sp. ARG-1]|uniref:Lrp/AsnC family transcriptional regulator n=1 Tax=Methylobacterium sp. ARG-1 TaxID=1692501 RepID=UPI000B14428B
MRRCRAIGFTLDIDPVALGYPLQALVRIRPLPGKLHVVQQLIKDLLEVVKCDKVTGEKCFFARLHVRTIGDLDEILDCIADKAETNTVIVKAQPVRPRMMPLDR